MWFSEASDISNVLLLNIFKRDTDATTQHIFVLVALFLIYYWIAKIQKGNLNRVERNKLNHRAEISN